MEEVAQPEENELAHDGKLIVEYKGARYGLEQDDIFHIFRGPDEAVRHKLNLAYSEVKVDEMIKAKKEMAYWYERPYAIGKKAAESLGAKIIEYEDEVYKQRDDEGNPIFY